MTADGHRKLAQAILDKIDEMIIVMNKENSYGKERKQI
jgi:hypothetical protein